MGKKVSKRNYDQQDFDEFSRRVKSETDLLIKLCDLHELDDSEYQSGFEIELFLLNKKNQLACNNINFIQNLHQNFLITEAVQSTIEINTPFVDLHAKALTDHRSIITDMLQQCLALAAKNDQNILMAGSVPSMQIEDYSTTSLTDENRYHALHNRLEYLREHCPTHIEIKGAQTLQFDLDTFALVGAISSFQIHFRVPNNKIARLYNTALAISAPMLAVCANSPYLFTKELWMESRIPFYEQILKTHRILDRSPRVFFGSGYLDKNITEIFLENYLDYYPLLPQVEDSPEEEFQHLRLHNGNIYRWNRAVLDFNLQNKPYFRIEHRALPAGPTIIDMLANAAFYFGLAQYYCNSAKPLEQRIPFTIAQKNFYAAARYGLKACIEWDDYIGSVSDLISKELLPNAREGLHQLDINTNDIDLYLSIIEARNATNRTGSQWQLDFMHTNRCDLQALVQRYLIYQELGNPVHEWTLE